jgi:hypothetical protein
MIFSLHIVTAKPWILSSGLQADKTGFRALLPPRPAASHISNHIQSVLSWNLPAFPIKHDGFPARPSAECYGHYQSIIRALSEHYQVLMPPLLQNILGASTRDSFIDKATFVIMCQPFQNNSSLV